MRFLTRSLVGLFLMALTVGVLAYAGYLVKAALDLRRNAESRPRPVQERVFTANVVTANARTITPSLIAFGEVQSRRSLQLRAPSAGQILELAPNFEEGARVQAGQLLVQINPTEAERARDVQRAALADAEGALAAATRAVAIAEDDLGVAEQQAQLREQALDRQRAITEGGFGTATAIETAELAAISARQAVLGKRSQLSQAQTQADQARNTVERQTIALAEAERKLANTRLVAEFDGLLSGVSAVTGGLVNNNEMLGTLIDPASLEVSFRISTTQFARFLDADGVLAPARAEVLLEVSGTPISATARLGRVGAVVGEGQTGRLVFAQIEAGSAGFRQGDFVTLRIEEPPLESVIELPAAAVDAVGRVLVLGVDDRLEEIATEVLRRQGDTVIVRAAALDGREVVAARSPLLGAGLKVRALRPGAAAQEPTVAPLAAGSGGGSRPPATSGEMVKLSTERREKLIAYVESNAGMSPEAKARNISQLQAEEVPLQVVERLEQRMGG
ncbi:MAG: efflux transporter periplasmic adaptor subunit [Phaeovulum sp.]|uniref:efflux RND transporter periplasmic adaptor subunit n=1 Tax=Phaeovulum sp. TaxID=2934796 RepID=UPI002734D891|nr:efflux transporter periplasmic adaptor subunit [Phaeovulum sp.]MDP3862422.1 efflux transporter periplasmic adaptor subunit [Phaeovulum sp.]